MIVSKPISRVLSFKTVIYLGVLLPTRSSHLLGEAGSALALDATPSTVLLQIEFTGPNSSQSAGELLPRLSTLTTTCVAVYLCCTFPKVAFGGRYPLSLPYGARTFLTNSLSACLRDCPAYSQSRPPKNKVSFAGRSIYSKSNWCGCQRESNGSWCKFN